MIRVVLSGMLPSALIGCVVAGDSYFRVAGSVPEEQPDVRCKLIMRSVDQNRVIDYRDVGMSFEASFVVRAKPSTYHFLVECGEGRVYRTDDYLLGRRETSNRTLQLGELKPTR